MMIISNCPQGSAGATISVLVHGSDHPRLRRAYFSSDTLEVYWWGPSPPARGVLLCGLLVGFDKWTIPGGSGACFVVKRIAKLSIGPSP